MSIRFRCYDTTVLILPDIHEQPRGDVASTDNGAGGSAKGGANAGAGTHVSQAKVAFIGRVVKAQAVSAEPLYDASRVRSTAQSAAQAAREEGQRVREESAAQASFMVQAATAQATQILKDAAEKAAQTQAQASAELVLSAQAALKAMRERATQEVYSMAVALAKATVQADLAIEPEHILAAAARTLAHARLSRQAALLMHPADAAEVRSALERVKQSAGHDGEISVHDDPTAARGTVRVHTERGVYDGSMERRVEELAKILLEMQRSGPDQNETSGSAS